MPRPAEDGVGGPVLALMLHACDIACRVFEAAAEVLADIVQGYARLAGFAPAS